jgi:hypothetical protein
VVQGLRNRDIGKPGFRRMQEWAAGGGKPYAPDFLYLPASQALVDRVVFAIDREQRLALPAGFGSNDLSRGDQAFLIGQSDCFASANGLIGGLKSRYTDDCAYDEIYVWVGSHANVSGGTAADLDSPDTSTFQFRL